jgi:hypothetical protein
LLGTWALAALQILNLAQKSPFLCGELPYEPFSTSRKPRWEVFSERASLSFGQPSVEDLKSIRGVFFGTEVPFEE